MRLDASDASNFRLARPQKCYNFRGNMTVETKVRKIGNSLGIILPKEALQELNAAEGTRVYLTEAADGTVKLTVAKPGFKEMMEIVDEGIRRYPNALRELAK